MNKDNLRDKFKKVGKVFAVGISIFIFGALAAYGGWFGGKNPPEGNIAVPLNTGARGQLKIGGLILNKQGENSGEGAKFGLIVNGENNTGKGEGGIVVGRQTQAKFEKLDVGGNIQISGILKPNGNQGTDDQIFTRTDNGNDWKQRFSWMTIAGVPSLCSNPIYPGRCELVGYKEYDSYCLEDEVNPKLSVTLRVCYKENQL